MEVTTSLMFDCNTFKDKRHLLILVAIRGATVPDFLVRDSTNAKPS